MIRNISQHDGSGTKNQFIEFIGDIADAVQRADSPNFVVECVGILGNLTIPDLDFDRLLEEYNLVPWIKERLRYFKRVFFLQNFHDFAFESQYSCVKSNKSVEDGDGTFAERYSMVQRSRI